MPQMWEVVGGGDKGGILVRDGEGLKAPSLGRLSMGALVEEISLIGERLHYKLVDGEGPKEGWVATKLPGKELLVKTDKKPSAAPAGAAGGAAADAFDMVAFNEERCKKDLAKPPVNWNPVGMEVLEKAGNKAKGLFYGIEFPWDEKTLAEMGPSWATKAFHAAGTIPADNKVTKVKNIKQYVGGGACAKLTFDVEYAKKQKGLHTELFAKIPWPLEGKTRSDRMASSVMQQGMELGEINAMRLLESRLPFKIPKYYFGDVSNETTNFIIAIERVPFNKKDEDGNQVDPPYEKGRDWELKGTNEEYYYMIIREGAKMAGMYHAEKLAPKALMDTLFVPNMRPPEQWGMGPHNTGIGDKEFLTKIKMGAEFIGSVAKALFPPEACSDAHLKVYKKILEITNWYTTEQMFWCTRNPDYVAWSHGNLNVDNVWYWRNKDTNALEMGVLDWGGARTDSMGWKLWWWLYGAEYEFLKSDIDKMLDLFIESYQENGGPLLEREELKMQFILSAMQQGVGLLGAVPQIYRMCPKKTWPEIKDRKDPKIANNIDGKNTLRIYVLTFITVNRMIAEWGVDDKIEAWLKDFEKVIPIPRKSMPEIA